MMPVTWPLAPPSENLEESWSAICWPIVWGTVPVEAMNLAPPEGRKTMAPSLVEESQKLQYGKFGEVVPPSAVTVHTPAPDSGTVEPVGMPQIGAGSACAMPAAGPKLT